MFYNTRIQRYDVLQFNIASLNSTKCNVFIKAEYWSFHDSWAGAMCIVDRSVYLPLCNNYYKIFFSFSFSSSVSSYFIFLLVGFSSHIAPVWNEWGPYSEYCSRTCGVGDQTRYRTCNDPRPDDAFFCHGSSSESMPCNTQPCPQGIYNFCYDLFFQNGSSNPLQSLWKWYPTISKNYMGFIQILCQQGTPSITWSFK